MAPAPVENAVQTNTAPQPNSGILDHSTASTNGQWTPQIVLSTLPAHSQPQPNTSSPVAFFHMLERLKTTKREGWRRFGIDRGESISDHMYRMSIITMLCPPSLRSRIDVNRCIKMALVHDMAELLVGDITPVDGVLKTEKSRRESTTMDYLCKDLLGNVSDGIAGEEIRQAWQEYEDSETLESHFVHDVDKVELILQMLEYEKAHPGKDLGEFTHVANRIVLPEVRQWCDQLLEDRKAYWKSIGKEPTGFAQEQEFEKQKLQDEYYSKQYSNGHQH